MKRRTLLIASAVLIARRASAKVRGRYLEDMIADAPVIVIGRITTAQRVDGIGVAQVEVEEVIRGDVKVGTMIGYFADKTWPCDETVVSVDERAVFLLRPPIAQATVDELTKSSQKLALTEGPSEAQAAGIREATGLELFVDVFWGRGKLRFDEDGQSVHIIKDGVFVRTPGVLGRQRIAIDDLRSLLVPRK